MARSLSYPILLSLLVVLTTSGCRLVATYDTAPNADGSLGDRGTVDVTHPDDGSSDAPTDAPLADVTMPDGDATIGVDKSAPLDEGTPEPDKATPDPDQGTPDPDKGTPIPDQSIPVADQSIPVADKGIPVADKSIPAADKSIPAADKSMPPDTSLPAMDKGAAMDKGGGSDAGQPCPKVLDEDTGSATGWYNTGLSYAVIYATSIEMPANLYSGIFRDDLGGLICFKAGERAVVELTVACTSDAVSIGFFDTALNHLGSCDAVCNGITISCTVPAAKVGGQTIGRLLLSRSAYAPTLATIARIKITGQ